MPIVDLKSFDKIYPIFVQKYETYIPSEENSGVTEKINSIITYLNQIGRLSNDVVSNWNKVMFWVMGEGLIETVEGKIDTMLLEGVFATLLDGIVNEKIVPFETMVDEKIVELETILIDLRDNGTGIDAQARTDIVNVENQLSIMDELKASKLDVANISSGTPLFADSVANMLDTSRVYVNTTDGFLYLYNTTSLVFEVTSRQYQSSGIARKSITINELQTVTTGKNLMNPDNLTIGYLNSNGTMNTGAVDYRTTDYIFVKGNIPFTAKTIRKLSLYNLSKTFTQYVDNPSMSNYTITPTSDGFLRVSFHKDFLSAMQVEEGSSATISEPYYHKLVYGKTSNVNPLEGKTILNLGDSIAYGAGSVGVAYADIIAQKNIMSVYDYSQSGATIADVTANDPTRACVQLKLNTFMSDNPLVIPDYILLEGGANDMTLSPLGSVTAWDYSEPFTKTEFCGGLESIISLLLTTYPTAKILFVTTNKLWSRTTVAQDSFYPKTIEVLNKWGIPVADVYKEGRLNTLIDVLRTNYAPDGTHPNEAGYRQFYVPIVESKMKSI